MSDGATGTDPAPTGASTPAAAAMDILREAEAAAAATRAEAERYARQRERGADLVLAKARRVLVAAEEKAAVIVATAHDHVRTVIDLDALAADDASAPEGTRLDGMLASAIANAVDSAFPVADER